MSQMKPEDCLTVTVLALLFWAAVLWGVFGR